VKDGRADPKQRTHEVEMWHVRDERRRKSLNNSMNDAKQDLLFEAVARHVQRRVGPIAEVYRFPGPEIVHVDVLHIPPNPS
jgi:hypothetical protein